MNTKNIVLNVSGNKMNKKYKNLLSGAWIYIIIIFMAGIYPTNVDAQQKPYDYKPADINQVKNDAGSDAMILPHNYLREFDPVTIMFSRDMHPEGPGPLDKPQQFVVLKPSHPGEYRWLDPRTIEFRPAIPWQPMQNYTIKVSQVSKTLTALLMPPQSVFPASGSADLDPVSRIMLEFREPIDVQTLSKLLTFETNRLPGIERTNAKVYGSSDFTIKKSEKTVKNTCQYWVIFKKPFGNGLRVRTILRLSSDPMLSDAKRIFYFDTKKEFTIEQAGTYDYQFTMNPGGSVYGREQALRLSSEGALCIDFSVPPASLSLSQVKSLVNFSPSPRKMEWSLSGKRLIINITPEQEKLYKVAITPTPVIDKEGRNLELTGKCSFFCYQPADRQYIRWGLGAAIVEKYGPQHFPLLAGGIKSIDLRIYKIDPLHKAFWPFPNSAVDVDETKRPPGPGEEPYTEDSINSPLNSWEMGSHIQMLGSPHYSQVVDLEKEGVIRFQSIDLKEAFSRISGENHTGTYLAGFRTLDGQETRSYIRVTVTDLCLSTVEAKSHVNFLVTSYSNGRPVEDAEIIIEGVREKGFIKLASGRTGRDGIYTMEHSEELQKSFKNSSVKRIIVRKDDDIIVLDTRGPELPPSFANNHWSESYSWLEWLSNDRYDLRKDRVEKGFIFTERPIYRPDETVYFKGYVRSLYQGKIENNDPAESYNVNITSPSGAKFTYPVKLSDYYSFNDSLTEKGLPTGEYRIELAGTREKTGEYVIAQSSFAVEAYRLPKFQVRLNGPEKAPNDRPVNITLMASYYAGGKVVNQNVSWRVVSYPYSYAPENVNGYLMSTDNRYGAVNGDNQNGVIEQNDVTGDDGQASLTVNVQSATNGNPRKYVCEATVTDVDEQTVSDRLSFVALPPFALGMKIDRHIKGTKSIKADIITLGIKGKFESAHKVNVQLKKVSWTSFLQETDFSRGKPKYVTQESVDLVAEKNIVSGTEPVRVEFSDNEPGVYILEISARDRLGRNQLVKADLFLEGHKAVTWKKSDKLIFETVPDKNNYEPGQTASILLKSPYQRGLALAVIEKPDGVPDYKLIDITDGQGTFNLQITPEMAPKIPVSFLLMRPRISNELKTTGGSYVDAGVPQTVANTTWLNVTQIDNVLNVTFNHPEVVKPGSKVDLTVNLKDGRGRPRDGEVALWLVDEAVLSLAKEKALNPLPSFTTEVASHITIRDSRNLVYGDLRIPESPGGDGEEGGNDDLFGKVTVRKNFKTVPYWNPNLIVDKSGQAVASFIISDDLTNFAVRAVAVSGSDRFGTGKSQVKVRLPLIVQPALPRFVRPHDKIKAGGVVRVVEGPGGDARFTTEIDGMKLSNGSLSGECKLEKDKPYPIRMEMVADDIKYDSSGNRMSDSVHFRMAVERLSDKISDAFSVSIPVIPDRTPVDMNIFADVSHGKPFQAPEIKDKIRPGTLKRQVIISNQMAILRAVAAMSYLVRYPHGCTEQRISRAYPEVVYRDIWSKYGIEAPEKSIKKYVAATIEYLERTQNQDGFFGYWPGCQGYTYLTAYVVEFLNEIKTVNSASAAGYAFNEDIYKKAIEALKRSLRTDYSGFVDGYKYYERSAALLALAKAGQIDIGYARELALQTNEKDVQSQARILEALYKNESALGSEIDGMNKSLWGQTVFKLDGGKEVFGGLQERSFRIGARVHTGEITSLASMVSAFSAAPKRSPKLLALVNELVSLGGEGSSAWGSTQANSLALLALRNYIAKPQGDGSIKLKFTTNNEQFEINHEVRNGAYTKELKNSGTAEIDLLSAPDNASVYVKYSHTYLPSEPGYMAKASQKGFAVRREINLIKADKQKISIWLDSANTEIRVKTGDIIEEHIQVQNPKDCDFVAISAPFAAGLEYMNPRLETSGTDATPSGTTTSAGSYQAYNDDQAVFYFERMNAGTYDFYYRVKATVAGEFTHPSARAEMMYDLAINGCSPGAKVVVLDK